MSALDPKLDLKKALAEVTTKGAAFVPAAVHQPFLKRLDRELDGGPFSPMPRRTGKVEQEAEVFFIRREFTVFPLVAELRQELIELVHVHGRGIRGLATWMPNEVTVQRYKPGTMGITPHVDGKKFARLLAVFTIRGKARFALCKDRAGEVIQEWETAPGSLVLLRGPGLGGKSDGRPFHMITGPKGDERCSIAFRMDSGRKR